MTDIYLAGGCFWGTEHYLKQIRGVAETTVGFAGGTIKAPTYEQVYTDTTGHAETVHVRFDEQLLPLRDLIELYFHSIDPVSLNRQGHDEGTRYRTAIFYTSEEQLPVIREVYDSVQAAYGRPLCVEVLPFTAFYAADESHQDYLDKHPDGYCHLPAEMFAYARAHRSM